MLSNDTGTNEGVNVTFEYVDKGKTCDIGVNDKDTNNNSNDNDLLTELCHNTNMNSGNLTEQNKSVNTKTVKMTIPQSGDSLSARRPPTAGLAPLVTDSSVDLDDNVKAEVCFSPDDEVPPHECKKGMNIKFQDIIYRAHREISWDRSTKTILNGISGEFQCGQLTAVMGPSGAGKSTLLDILTGYTTNLASGTITVNGRSRDLKRFRRQTTYIMQNNELHMHITVWEAMLFSVNLKIGGQLIQSEKKERIREILEAIGLYEQRKTKTGDLSGGQRKRLAIALELVDNPLFMAFDEPTSGLDSSTSTQVILLLKQLAEEGRTIVCSIHQPSALLFGLFDHLYALADGQCIYAGATGMLVPFLAELDLICPKTYNPSDYLLEISTHDYGPLNGRLVTKMENGMSETYRMNAQGSTYNYSLEVAAKMIEGGLMTPVYAPDLAPLLQNTPSTTTPSSETRSIGRPRPKFSVNHGGCCVRQRRTYATSFCRQLYLLISRTSLCLRRDRSWALMRLNIHLCIALLVGTLYYNIGNDASMMFNNFRYIFLTLMFLMFTSFCSMTILFPLEMPIVAREHFNRWYSKKAYYFAITFSDLPLQFACVFIYVMITYLMTAQPLELFRLSLFFCITCMVTLISQGLGMIVGAAFGVKWGVIIGPFFIAPFVIFAGFFLRLADSPAAFKWIFHISYMKLSLEGAAQALFGYNRPKLPCNEIYCHYRLPAKFLKVIDMHHGDFMSAFCILLVICIVLRFVAFFTMSIRLKHR